MLKDFLGQKDRGELTLQKIGTLRDNIMKSVSHTQSHSFVEESVTYVEGKRLEFRH